MKKIISLLFLFLPVLTFAQTKSSDVIGVWLTGIEDAKVEVYKKDGKYYGRVIWIAEPLDDEGNPVTDRENPNESLTSRPILGMDILTGFVYDDGEWEDGFIYDPKSGDTYDCKLWIEGNHLKVRGYLGWLFDTKTWTRVK